MWPFLEGYTKITPSNIAADTRPISGGQGGTLNYVHQEALELKIVGIESILDSKVKTLKFGRVYD